MPKRKISNSLKADGSSHTSFLSSNEYHDEKEAALPPKRLHMLNYHRPRLLKNRQMGTALLDWFDLISEKRQMPWRKPWLNPAEFEGDKRDFESALAKRAHEIWVSEVMLQQTRVSVVITYFNNWIAKWPTVEDLAAATQDQVLAAWKGLGYYSRATRLHEAAQQIISEMQSSLPPDVEGLLKIKGIGRYTAGAVASIAFGQAVPLLDGNVGRVLCRQLGLYARVKDKKIEDLLWKVAEVLVKDVARHDSEDRVSDVPGRWNQALMELGSTVCTPKPKCQECPVKQTCRAYAEGELLAQTPSISKSGNDTVDIEDLCDLCEPLQLEEVEEAVEVSLEEQVRGNKEPQGRKRAATVTTLPSRPAKTAKAVESKQRLLRDFASFTALSPKVKTPLPSTSSACSGDQIVAYCSSFPKRERKKQIPEDDCLVCVIQRLTGDGKQYLIEQRPPDGLLASLWQFPTYNIPKKTETTPKTRKAHAQDFVRSLLDETMDTKMKPLGEIGPITHIFSHLKLQMYIHAFTLDWDDALAEKLVAKELPKRMWVDMEGVDDATLGTGMRRCWEQYLRDAS
jgi:A/G-specific adenine glycosylase